LQGCGPRGKPRVAQHTLGSVRRCEGMNSHTPREFHFGSWSPSGVPNLQRAIAGVKIQWLEEFFYINGKLLERRYLKWVHIAHLDI